MSIQQLLENRVSTMQNKMTGGEVKKQHLIDALKSTQAVPIHGSENPFHFVVFDYENRTKALNILYRPKQDDMNRDRFDKNWGGVGAVVFMFIKKGVSERIPDYESEYSGSSATYAMQLSLVQNGYCVKWNSIYDHDGRNPTIFEDLNLNRDNYKSLGILLIGTGEAEPKQRPDYSEYTDWK